VKSLLAFPLVLSALVGCGGGSDSSPRSAFSGLYEGSASTQIEPTGAPIQGYAQAPTSGSVDRKGFFVLTTTYETGSVFTDTFEGRIADSGKIDFVTRTRRSLDGKTTPEFGTLTGGTGTATGSASNTTATITFKTRASDGGFTFVYTLSLTRQAP